VVRAIELDVSFPDRAVRARLGHRVVQVPEELGILVLADTSRPDISKLEERVLKDLTGDLVTSVTVVLPVLGDGLFAFFAVVDLRIDDLFEVFSSLP